MVPLPHVVHESVPVLECLLAVDALVPKIILLLFFFNLKFTFTLFQSASKV